MTMREALSKLDQYVDPSDPDLDLPNSYHAYQTAEMVRRDHPDDEEFQVVGLIHDVGKVLYEFGEPSWAVVGDTFVVGCAFAPSIVYPDTFDSNPDKDDLRFNTKLGIYEAGCGIENLQLSFGHDEYLHSVLVRNPTAHRLSKRSLAQIRFHSFYPWHTGGDYGYFEAPGDDLLKRDVLEFNKYDLYSKAVVDGDVAECDESERDVAERDVAERDDDSVAERDDDKATNANNNRFRLTDDMIRYYDRLLEKFFPEPIRWMAPNHNE
jgi:inositol oxygenase